MNRLLRAMAGLILWGAAFNAVYALEGLGCALGWGSIDWGAGTALRTALVGAWTAALLAHLALIGWLLRERRRAPNAFWSPLESGLAFVGLIATSWTLLPVVAMRTCV